MIPITRYCVRRESLIPWVKFIWYLEEKNGSICNKLLPTDSIDIILNLSSPMIYEVNKTKIAAPSFHINNLRNEYSFIYQTSPIYIFGISLYSYGLFPFIHKHLTDFQGKIIDLHDLSPALAASLQSAVSCGAAKEVVFAIEKVLNAALITDVAYLKKAKLMQEYINMDENVTIQEFCFSHKVNIKTFERWVLQYTGFTPKKLYRIRRFQTASNQLAHQNKTGFADVAYVNDYADQSHMIKEFCHFSGMVPRVFEQEKITVKKNAVYTYI